MHETVPRLQPLFGPARSTECLLLAVRTQRHSGTASLSVSDAYNCPSYEGAPGLRRTTADATSLFRRCARASGCIGLRRRAKECPALSGRCWGWARERATRPSLEPCTDAGRRSVSLSPANALGGLLVRVVTCKASTSAAWRDGMAVRAARRVHTHHQGELGIGTTKGQLLVNPVPLPAGCSPHAVACGGGKADPWGSPQDGFTGVGRAA